MRIHRLAPCAGYGGAERQGAYAEFPIDVGVDVEVRLCRSVYFTRVVTTRRACPIARLSRSNFDLGRAFLD